MGLGKTVQVLALLELPAPRPVKNGRRAPRWSWCPAAWSSTGSKRRGSSRPTSAWPTIPGRCKNPAGSGQLRPRRHDLWDLAPGHHQAQGRPLRLHDPQRSPGNQECPVAKGQDLPLASDRPSVGRDRHAHADPWANCGRCLSSSTRACWEAPRRFKRSRRRPPQDSENVEFLRHALAPFILRPTKQQVLTELPQKTEQTLFCDLEGRSWRRSRAAARLLSGVALPTDRADRFCQGQDPRPGGPAATPPGGPHPGLIDQKCLDRPSASSKCC